MTQQFTLAEVLTVTSGKLLCPIGRVYEILNFLAGDNLFTHQLPRAMAECKPHLTARFPDLAAPSVSVFAVGELTLMLETESGQRDAGAVIVGWLSRLQTGGKYGPALPATFDLEPLPEHAHEFIDAMSELAEHVHPSKIVTVGR